MPKMSATNPMQAAMKLRMVMALCFGIPPIRSCTNITRAAIPSSANGSDKRITRVRSVLGSGRQGGFVFENPAHTFNVSGVR